MVLPKPNIFPIVNLLPIAHFCYLSTPHDSFSKERAIVTTATKQIKHDRVFIVYYFSP
jgi:hypothetical protein